VDTSSNVLVEDLQNTRSLETTYYVTDATQEDTQRRTRDAGHTQSGDDLLRDGRDAGVRLVLGP